MRTLSRNVIDDDADDDDDDDVGDFATDVLERWHFC